MTTIRRELSKLSSSDVNIYDRSIILSERLKNEDVDLVGYIRSLLSMDFYEIFNSDYCYISVKKYLDTDDYYRLAISISFIQDYKSPIDAIESFILEDLIEEIKSRNLQFVFNDVTINDKQWRNDV